MYIYIYIYMYTYIYIYIYREREREREIYIEALLAGGQRAVVSQSLGRRGPALTGRSRSVFHGPQSRTDSMSYRRSYCTCPLMCTSIPTLTRCAQSVRVDDVCVIRHSMRVCVCVYIYIYMYMYMYVYI